MSIKIVKPEPSYFDFLGIPYKWGGTNPNEGLDCFTFYNYVLYRYKSKILEGWDWVRGDISNHNESPPKWVIDQAKKLFGEDNYGGRGDLFNLVIINWAGGRAGVGIILSFKGTKYIACMGSKKSSMIPYSKVKSRIIETYNPEKIAVEVDTFYGNNI